jgi:hypothetical protein
LGVRRFSYNICRKSTNSLDFKLYPVPKAQFGSERKQQAARARRLSLASIVLVYWKQELVVRYIVLASGQSLIGQS